MLITGICWIPPSALGIQVAFIRLLRLARLFKLAEQVKELRVLVIGLMHGLSSVSYVLILMFLAYYTFAVLGAVSFQRNDPFLFGGVGISMLSLFRIATFEAWTNVVLLQYYGCKTQNWMVTSVSSLLVLSFYVLVCLLRQNCPRVSRTLAPRTGRNMPKSRQATPHTRPAWGRKMYSTIPNLAPFETVFAGILGVMGHTQLLTSTLLRCLEGSF